MLSFSDPVESFLSKYKITMLVVKTEFKQNHTMNDLVSKRTVEMFQVSKPLPWCSGWQDLLPDFKSYLPPLLPFRQGLVSSGIKNNYWHRVVMWEEIWSVGEASNTPNHLGAPQIFCLRGMKLWTHLVSFFKHALGDILSLTQLYLSQSGAVFALRRRICTQIRSCYILKDSLGNLFF